MDDIEIGQSNTSKNKTAEQNVQKRREKTIQLIYVFNMDILAH